MNEIIKENSVNVELIVKKVKGSGDKTYNQLFLKFKNGFIIRIDAKFELTLKQWSYFQDSIDEEIDNVEGK